MLFLPTQRRNLKMTTSQSLISETSFSRGKSSSASASSPVSLSTEVTRKLSPKSVSPENSSSSQSMSSEHQCAYCGSSSVHIKHVTRSFGKASALLVIEATPMWSCPSCGESYFSAQTMHEIERIKALRKSVAVSRKVPVAAFQEAAV